ncbi:RNA-directed DNA polymerase, partial [Streptococcus mutans]|nr:RNA-directed DNA polymerase [Streptococcus mutans]
MPNRSVLDMTSSEARKFFLKAESYFSVKLPPYFNLKEILEESAKLIGNSDMNSISYGQKNIKKFNKNASELDVEYIKDASDVNLRIMANKDAKYAWRPFQLIHPILYVDLVNTITKDENWQTIVDRFSEFQSDNRINCISIPVESTGEKLDQAEQILNWWKNLEQAQIALSLDYEYCIHTDITDCYPSIYTHTIPWALHDKNWAKENRKEGIGNIIDSKLQSMQNGQTNGIPQGSSLMDFIAEMVLGYADTQLIKLANKKGLDNDYKILRYRDDYRIFSNQLNTAESLMKILSEVLLDLNLKINSKKTFLCNDIIIDGVKPDKIYWTTQSANFFNYTAQISIDTKDKDLEVSGNLNNIERKRHYKINLQKHLLQIKI